MHLCANSTELLVSIYPFSLLTCKRVQWIFKWKSLCHNIFFLYCFIYGYFQEEDSLFQRIDHVPIVYYGFVFLNSRLRTRNTRIPMVVDESITAYSREQTVVKSCQQGSVPFPAIPSIYFILLLHSFTIHGGDMFA